MFERFLKTETEKEKHSDEIIGLLTDSVTVSALKAERQAKVQEQRRAAVARITEAESERDETLPALFEQLQAARLRIEEIDIKFKADMKTACRERDEKDYEHNRAKFRFDNAIETDRRLLRDTTAPEIDEFWRWLLAADDKARHSHETHIAIKKEGMGPATRTFDSNAKAIAQRREAIKKAMERVELMKFEVVEDVAAEIATLKASIPADSYVMESSEVILPIVQPDYDRYGGEWGADQKKHLPPPVRVESWN
jgi:hypothetical protein